MAKEKYSNLLLICAAGITTGLLVRSMQKTIEEQDLPIHERKTKQEPPKFSVPFAFCKQTMQRAE